MSSRWASAWAQMKASKRRNQVRTPRPAPESETRRPAPARVSRRWALSAALLGSVALISGAIHFSTRPASPRTSPKVQAPAGPSAILPASAESNRLAGPAPESATINSNWDAVITGQQKTGVATELATRANALLAAGDVKSAVRVLEQALRLKPEDEDLHYNLGIAYGRSGDVSNAEHQYREALRLLPDYPEVHNNLGNLLLHAGRLSEAEEQLTEAIKQMPELSTAHNSLGIVRKSQNRMPEAITCFRKAVQYNTNYWQAHFNLAQASLSQGATDEGRRELQIVLRLNPGYAPAQSALDKLSAQPAGQ